MVPSRNLQTSARGMKSVIIPKLLDHASRFRLAKLNLTHSFVIWSQGQDNLSESYQNYLNWVAGMGSAKFWFVIRAFGMLGISTTLCALVFFRFNCRVSAVQWAVCLLGCFLSMELPIELIPLSRTAKGWLFAFSVLGIATLPWGLAWLLARKDGWRKVIALSFCCILGVLFISNFFRN